MPQRANHRHFSLATKYRYAGLAVQMAGAALWPAVVLHTVLTIWCILCLRA